MATGTSAHRFQPVARQGRFGGLLLAFALTFGAFGQSASANEFKRINDINVSCNNALRCDLFITNPRVTLSNFGLRRAAAPDAPVSIVLTTREAFARGSVVSLLVDGNEIASIDVDDLAYRAAVSEYSFRDETIVNDLISASSAGRELQVQYQARLGPTSATFRLPGFNEGVAFLDQVQGRTGRESALTNRAASAEIAAADESEIDSFASIPFAIRSRYFTGSNALCAALSDSELADQRAFALRLDDERSVYGLPCGETDASGTPFSFFAVGDRQASLMALPMITDDGITTGFAVPNIELDPVTRRLSAVFASDPAGTCRAHIWVLADDADRRPVFTLVEARANDACDGDPGDETGGWSQIWPPTISEAQD